MESRRAAGKRTSRRSDKRDHAGSSGRSRRPRLLGAGGQPESTISKEQAMARCTHMPTIHEVTPSAKGCEECLKTGSWWVHLRLCRACGHVGCCDDSPNKHATAHFHATQHPIIE